MPSPRKRVVACVSAGEPRKTMGKTTETVKCIIHDFENRTEKRGEGVVFSPVQAHGYEWKIVVYPRGDVNSKTDIEHVSFHFLLYSDAEVTAYYIVRCNEFINDEIPGVYTGNGDGWGWSDFVPRDYALEELVQEDGSLVIEVDLQIAEEDRRVWYPEKLLPQKILVDLYEDASSPTSDTVFSVGKATYRVHKNILSIRCKKLYELSKDSGDAEKPIPIASVKAEIFKYLLDFVYTVKAPDIKEEKNAIEILVAADLYDCVPLKLYAESVLVDRFLTAKNAVSLYMLADARSCALLKEAATKVFLTDTNTVKKSRDWNKIVESHRLLKELLDAFMSFQENFRSNNDPSKNSTDGAEQLDVASLRDELQQANLEVDGSREILVNRWKTLHQAPNNPAAKRRKI